MQLTKGRKVVAVILAIGGAFGTVVAVLSNMQTLGSYIAPSLRPYLAIVPAICFVFAAFVIRHADAPVDGVLYRENIANRRRIEELETQLRDVTPRDITHAQRSAIAMRLDEMPEFAPGEMTFGDEHLRYRPGILIGALPNAPDSRHLAEALEEILQFRFDVEWIDDKTCLTFYSIRDVYGIVLLQPHDRWWMGFNGPQWQEHYEKYGQFIIDSFRLENIRIDKFPRPAIGNLKQMTLLVGRKA